MNNKLNLFFIIFILLSSCKQESTLTEVPNSTMTSIRIDSCSIEEAMPSENKEIITLTNGISLEQVLVNKRSSRNNYQDTIYILGADILITPKQLASMENSSRSAFTTDFVDLWPRGIVYYHIDESIDNRSIFDSAVNYWESVTSLEFIEKETLSGDCINVIKGSGCYSYIGRTGGIQDLSIGNNCSVGNAKHEIGHAIGLFHEHTRNNRDLHITVNYRNIKPGKEHNFDKYATYYNGQDFGDLDFSSIMMYSSTDFAVSPSRPSMLRVGGRIINKQRDYLSEGDIAAIEYLYGPPFAKIEKTQVMVNEEINQTWDYYEAIYDVSISFYSDKACTIPCTTSSARRLSLEYVESTLFGDTYEHITLIIPEGVTSYPLGTVRHYERNELGTLTEYLSQQYLISGVGH